MLGLKLISVRCMSFYILIYTSAKKCKKNVKKNVKQNVKRIMTTIAETIPADEKCI